MSDKPSFRRMTPNDPEKLNVKRTFLVGLGFMTAMVAWSYYNFTVPLILDDLLPDVTFWGFMGKDTLKGFIMTLDNIVAVLFQPYFGALSDRMSSKYGRRMPFILIGCSIGAVLFATLPHIGVIGPLIAVIMLFNFAMAFYRAPVVSLMPDVTPHKVRSTGNAIINLMGGVGTVIAYATPMIAGVIFGSANSEENPVLAAAITKNSRVFGFTFIAVFMLIGLVLLFITIKETKTGEGFWNLTTHPVKVDPITLELTDSGIGEDVEGTREEKTSTWEDITTVFREKERSALFMLCAIFSWFFGFNAIETFYSSYATESLKWTEGQASGVLLLLPVMLIVTAVPNGKLAERIGRKKTMTFGLYGVIATVLIISFMSNMIVIALLLAVAGMFWGMININSIAVVWQLSPKGKIGAYTGVYYTFSQMAAILSPVFAGLLFDLWRTINGNLAPGEQYLLLFPYVLIWMVIAFLFLKMVKRGEADDLPLEEIEKLKEEYNIDDD